MTCSRKPIKAKKVRAEDSVNWLRLRTSLTQSSSSTKAVTRDVTTTLLMPFIPKASQKSFLNKRLFHLPTKYYHIFEGNTATLSNSQQFMTGQNAAGNSANGGNDFSSGKSSIYFPPKYRFAAALSKGGS